MSTARHGVFITLEGIEGVGKSTHAGFVADCLRSAGHIVRLTREPGGTPAGEAIRDVLLHRHETPIAPATELLLIFAARAQHLEQVIRPALAAGEFVVCDRFTDATFAYQGGGRGAAPETIRNLEQWVQQGLRPDLTLLFDAPVQVGMERARRRGGPDRFEGESPEFFERVRERYLEIAHAEPGRVTVVDARRDLAAIQAGLRELLRRRKWI